VYLYAGTIAPPYRSEDRWRAWENVPDRVPPARKYWLVFRLEGQPGGPKVPDAKAAESVSLAIASALRQALRQGLKVGGIQLDIDCPTKSLTQCAEFLREFRNQLQPRTEISVTALLDWFRDGTDIRKVIDQVDEFVPQFYDVAPGDDRKAIATSFESSRWAPRFNRFRKRYLIGISTFGRARVEIGGQGVGYYRDVRPADFGSNPAFKLQVSHNDANELVLRYEAVRKITLGYTVFRSADFAEFIMSTEAEIRSAVQSARSMGGYCGGVVFFRWPGPDEVLAMDPSAVMRVAAFKPTGTEPSVTVRAVDGHCAAVTCLDLFLLNKTPLLPESIHYRIRSSVGIEYFVAAEGRPAHMADSTHIEFTVPPYGGESRTYLGRAVTATKPSFKVEQQ
jgi:hypothetical protein